MAPGFRERLRNETRLEHEKVDKHPFIERVKVDETCMKLYIDFNNLMLELLAQESRDYSYSDVFEVKGEKKVSVFDFEKNENFKILIDLMMKFPIQIGYMFGFGVLYGGHIIKKMISKENTGLLDYYESINLKNPEKFKHCYKTVFLTLYTKEEDDFIKFVNNTYPIIYNVFTDLLDFQATSTN